MHLLNRQQCDSSAEIAGCVAIGKTHINFNAPIDINGFKDDRMIEIVVNICEQSEVSPPCRWTQHFDSRSTQFYKIDNFIS
eukprot:scaffold398_cov198-Alexandrium_tamarense.AAC.12